MNAVSAVSSVRPTASRLPRISAARSMLVLATAPNTCLHLAAVSTLPIRTSKCRSPSSQLRMKVESKVTAIASASTAGLVAAFVGSCLAQETAPLPHWLPRVSGEKKERTLPPHSSCRQCVTSGKRPPSSSPVVSGPSPCRISGSLPSSRIMRGPPWLLPPPGADWARAAGSSPPACAWRRGRRRRARPHRRTPERRPIEGMFYSISLLHRGSRVRSFMSEACGTSRD